MTLRTSFENFPKRVPLLAMLTSTITKKRKFFFLEKSSPLNGGFSLSSVFRIYILTNFKLMLLIIEWKKTFLRIAEF